MKTKKTLVAILSIALVATLSAATWPTKKPIYMISANSAVSINPIVTTGDVIAGNVIRGIPDGMGAFDNGRGGITLLSNHEVSTTDKVALRSKSDTRQWGVSITAMNYSPTSKTVTSAGNLFNNIKYWNYKTNSYQDSPLGGEPTGAAAGTFGWGISRFCSATFSPAGTFIYNGIGYEGSLFTTGEEIGDSSRGFAFDMNGNGYQLPRVGMLSMENIVPSRKPGINTMALINEDGSATDSQLHMYLGKKQSAGSPVDQAGLTNGDLYVLNVPTVSDDNVFRTTIAKSTPVDAIFKKIEWNTDVPGFAKGARENGFRFARIEDGEWDPNNPDVFYFITTESNKDPVATKENPSEPGVPRDGGGLWRLTFKDAQNPLLGAKLELLLNGGEVPYLSKPDNMAISKDGVILIQEDPGNNAHVARIVAYRIKDGKLATVATFDPKYFTAAGSNFMTLDEESSGIIDATSLLRKGNDKNSYFFLNAQVHTYSGVTVVDSGVKGATTPSRPDLVRSNSGKKSIIDNASVEGGQYYVMTVTDWNEVFKG